MGDNLLDPLTFDYPEASRFVVDRVCAFCGSNLLLQAAPDRKYHIVCPEHRLVYDHTHISRSTARKVDANIAAGMVEMRPKCTLTPEEIIKKLGF